MSPKPSGNPCDGCPALSCVYGPSQTCAGRSDGRRGGGCGPRLLALGQARSDAAVPARGPHPARCEADLLAQAESVKEHMDSHDWGNTEYRSAETQALVDEIENWP
jgi:hypothetical protein